MAKVSKLLSTYELFYPPVVLDFDNWTSKQARDYFDWFVGEIPKRLDILRRTVEAVRPECVLDMSPESLVCLGEFLFDHIEVRGRTAAEVEQERSTILEHLRHYIPVNDWELTGLTYSLCVDVGIYLGEILRRQYGTLNWELWTKKSDGINRPMITGFSSGIPMDPVRVAGNLALRSVDGEASSSALREVLEVWAQH